MANKLPFLRVDKTNIVDENGKRVFLKGVSLGGWLMMEGYMTGGRNIPEQSFKEEFGRALGKEALDDFVKSYRDTFIREDDIKDIKKWGANCIRVPFNYRIIEFEDKPFSLNAEGLAYLNRVVSWCEKHGLYCILDLHAAPGCQNEEWHSDSTGKQELFENEVNKDRYLRLWHFIADLYKTSSAVAGYDVLNEPVIKVEQEGLLKDLYQKVTKEIRDIDKNHIIFLEGNLWGQRLHFLGKPKDDNTAFSIHAYPPAPFVFNLERGLHYPGKAYGIQWNKSRFEMLSQPYRLLMDRVQVPLYVGEFGVNYRDGYYGELAWVKDMADIFEKHKIHWSYWTYKTVANSVYPDGVYRYVKNPPWVNRQGPVTGWENFSSLWPKQRTNMIASWKTENFARNNKLYSLLKNYF